VDPVLLKSERLKEYDSVRILTFRLQDVHYLLSYIYIAFYKKRVSELGKCFHDRYYIIDI
jgi:hypothetical protein